jgi:hypothetical protein
MGGGIWAQSAIVRGCVLKDCQNYGIVTLGARVTDNRVEVSSGSADGIRTQTPDPAGSHIEGNTIVMVPGTTGTGIELSTPRNVCVRNTIWHDGVSGLSVSIIVGNTTGPLYSGGVLGDNPWANIVY